MKVVLQILQDVEHLGLDGNVDADTRLIGDDELRPQGRADADADPLTLTSGELVG